MDTNEGSPVQIVLRVAILKREKKALSFSENLAMKRRGPQENQKGGCSSYSLGKRPP